MPRRIATATGPHLHEPVAPRRAALSARAARWVIAVAVVVALLPLGWLGLDVFVTHEVQKAFDIFSEGYQATFADVSVQPTRLGATVHEAKLVKPGAGGEKDPYFYAQKVQVGFSWRRLMRGELVTYVDAQKPKVSLILAKQRAKEQLQLEVPDVQRKLKELMDVKVDQVHIKDGELLLVDTTAASAPRLWVHHLEAALDNLEPSPKSEEKLPSTLTLKARFQSSATLTAMLTADPHQMAKTFTGRAELENLKLAELHGLVASKTGLTVDRGTLNLVADVTAQNGVLNGTLKPHVTDAHVTQGAPGADHAINAAFADSAVTLLADRSDGRKTISTVIPLRGTINRPTVDFGPLVLSVLRNAFAIGLDEQWQQPQAEPSPPAR